MLGRTTARLTATVAMAAGFGLVAATTAGAHECFNASRSAQGDAMAGSHSRTWVTVNIADFVADDVAHGVYTAEQGECIYSAYLDAGGVPSFTTKVRGTGPDFVVGTDRNGRATDGKGIDHFFDVYGGAIFGAFAQCGVEFPGGEG